MHGADFPAARESGLKLEFPRAEAVLVRDDVDALADEFDAFHFEAHPLLESGFELQLDLTAGADHALPWEIAVSAAQERGDVAVVERVSGGRSHLAVGRDLALRD